MRNTIFFYFSVMKNLVILLTVFSVFNACTSPGPATIGETKNLLTAKNGCWKWTKEKPGKLTRFWFKEDGKGTAAGGYHFRWTVDEPGKVHIEMIELNNVLDYTFDGKNVITNGSKEFEYWGR